MKWLGYLKSWTIIEQRSDLELHPGFDQHILASNDDHWYMFLAMFTSNFSSLSLTCTSAFRCFITYQLVESYGWIVSVDLNILHLRYIFCWKKISQSLLNIGYPNEILENCWQVGLNQPRLANPLPNSLYNIQKILIYYIFICMYMYVCRICFIQKIKHQLRYFRPTSNQKWPSDVSMVSHPQHLSRLEKALGSEANVLLSEDSGLEGVIQLGTVGVMSPSHPTGWAVLVWIMISKWSGYWLLDHVVDT